MFGGPIQPKFEVGHSASEGLKILAASGIASPEDIAAKKKVWDVLAVAIIQSRDIRPDQDTPAGAWGGTYRSACKALTWLLSLDAYAWMEQAGAGPVVHNLAKELKFQRLYHRIRACAKRSETGQQWLESEDFVTLGRLVKEATKFLSGGGYGSPQVQVVSR